MTPQAQALHDAFKAARAAGDDPYTAVAAQLFGKPVSAVTTEERREAKLEVYALGWHLQPADRPGPPVELSLQPLESKP